MIEALLSGLGMGLASTVHCAAMCGPLATYATGWGAHPRRAAGAYQLGRTMTYAALGALAGYGGARIVRAFDSPFVPTVLSFSLALLLLVAAWRAWPSSARPVELVQLRRERTRIHGRPMLRAAAIGLGSGLLPCGVLAFAVLGAATSHEPREGALLMLGFASTTGLGVLGAATLGRWLRSRGPAAQRVLAAVLLIGAVGTAARSFRSSEEAPCHTPVGSQKVATTR